jgi:hypothetical protein
MVTNGIPAAGDSKPAVSTKKRFNRSRDEVRTDMGKKCSQMSDNE